MRIQCSLSQEDIEILKICAVNKMISECVKYIYIYLPLGMWDLSSPSRD